MRESYITLSKSLTMKPLTDSEKILLGLIAGYRDKGCYMTNSEIGERLCWDERKVRRVVEMLRKDNAITYECDGHNRKMWSVDNPAKNVRVISGNPAKNVQEPGEKCPGAYKEVINTIKVLHAPASDGLFSCTEPTPKKRTPKTLPIPSLDEVIEYLNHHPEYNDVDPEGFWNYYEARGWKYGRGVDMKNWKAAVRTWHFKNIKRSAHV
jgi:hypothetical protein